jgi:hypothetical protein
MAKIIQMPDPELEAQLKKYAAAKKAKKAAEEEILTDFSEVDYDSVTIKDTSGNDLEDEEDDEDE